MGPPFFAILAVHLFRGVVAAATGTERVLEPGVEVVREVVRMAVKRAVLQQSAHNTTVYGCGDHVAPAVPVRLRAF